METIQFKDLEILLERKKIQNLNLRIKPNGKICVSAPYYIPMPIIMDFVSEKYEWVKSKLQNHKKFNDYRFVVDDSITLFGKTYPFKKVVGNKNGMTLDDDIVLTVKETADENKVLEKFLKEILMTVVVNELLPERSRKTGLNPSKIAIRDMKTRWGSCNIQTKKITLSLQLVKKPMMCIDYVLTHELGHLVNRYHDARFYNYMDNNYPNWQIVKKLLNGQLEWNYE